MYRTSRSPTGSSSTTGYTDDGIIHASARFGYSDAPHIPTVLGLIAQSDIERPLDLDDVTYFLSTIELHVSDAPGMSRWRKHLFLANVADHRRRRRVLRTAARAHRHPGIARCDRPEPHFASRARRDGGGTVKLFSSKQADDEDGDEQPSCASRDAGSDRIGRLALRPAALTSGVTRRLREVGR